jgi:tRNA(Ile)-lysidine synthase
MADVPGRLDPAVAAVRTAVRSECSDLEPGTAVVVACSGGADSLALVAATIFEADKSGWLLSAAVVDHGLQVGSAATAAEVADRVRAMGCDDVQVVKVDVGRDGGPENAARAARYAALESIAEERDAVVLLGHTSDDQAETVLLGLARGSGVRSLAGMAPRRGRMRRPFLRLPRSTTERVCAVLGLETWQDPHNAETRFSRVRARQRVLPILEAELGPGIAAALARTAWLARDDADALDLWAERAYDQVCDNDGAIDADLLSAEPAAVRRRVIKIAAVAAGVPASDLAADHLVAVDRLLTAWHGQHGVDLPGNVVASREEGRLRLHQRAVGG